MASTFRIRRSDGAIIISGLDATDASLTVIDAPPSAGTYTYYLEILGPVARVLSMIQAQVVKK